ncbi:hypothetical protein LJR225_000414 [Phenylobacterium sp. LjRoot225]|uniref:hypothetical protein n=1 Tax=Phenylobacterium sp. LjRoot225 TaxID=3342285 RepID=UPI003ED06596
MMAFLLAHGIDPGPLQRPLLAGAITGLIAAAPAGAAFAALGAFTVVADQVMRLPRPVTAVILVAAFTLAGALYGLVFRRAANDRRGGWLFGAAFGFVLWMAAPVVVLPLVGGGTIAAGRAATGFFACFLVWGLVAGALFPLVHAPLQGGMDQNGRSARFGPSAASMARGLLRRAPRQR